MRRSGLIGAMTSLLSLPLSTGHLAISDRPGVRDAAPDYFIPGICRRRKTKPKYDRAKVKRRRQIARASPRRNRLARRAA